MSINIFFRSIVSYVRYEYCLLRLVNAERLRERRKFVRAKRFLLQRLLSYLFMHPLAGRSTKMERCLKAAEQPITHKKILYYVCVNAKAVCRWLCLKITSTVPAAQTSSNLWIDFNSCNNRRTSIRECRLAWICRFVEAIFCFVRDRALT